MSNPPRILLCTAAIAGLAAAQNASRPELTARELFYNATPAPAAKATPSKQTPKQVAKKASQAAPVTQQAAGNSQPAQPSQLSRPTAPIVNASDTIPVRTTAPAPVNGTALGLKYTILKLSGASMTPVAPNSVFHAYDKIQFSIETNTAGYLYIVNQGSSGTWMPMFPSPEIAGGSNYVEGFHTYTFPPEHRFVFDQQTGEEKMFIIFSREAKPDFQELVYSLQGKKTAPAGTPRPAEPAGPVLRASIDDSAVDRLHKTYARDLVIERIGDEGTAPRADTQEKAVYVVNASGSADSALVTDLHLVHR
jgi:Domain of unknown function (DUF4384)